MLQVHELLGGDVDRDLLVVALTAAGPPVRGTTAAPPGGCRGRDRGGARGLRGGGAFRLRRPGPRFGGLGVRGRVFRGALGRRRVALARRGRDGPAG
ncbi:hypothetical protein BN2537_13551 [Streptomyces venezuelae]|nr:hypothetical protein BN2537_13551 [Streptomyces venezuelae]